MNLLKKYVKLQIFRDEHRFPWVHSQIAISHWYPVSSNKSLRTSKARDSNKQMFNHTKARRWTPHSMDSSATQNFVNSNEWWFWSSNKRHFSPVIHRYSEQPNDTARDLDWRNPLHVWRHRCEMDSTTPFNGSILKLPHPQIGFILDSSATSPNQAQHVSPSKWHEVQQLQVLKVSSWWEWARARAKGQWTTDQLWSGVHFEEAGQRPFVIPCASWCEQKCESSSCDCCASEMWKFPFEEALDKKNAILAKRPFQLSQNPFHG